MTRLHTVCKGVGLTAQEAYEAWVKTVHDDVRSTRLQSCDYNDDDDEQTLLVVDV